MQSSRQGLPLDILHGDEQLAVGLADLVNRADVGMVERRRCTRLSHQPLSGVIVCGRVRWQQLDRHAPAQVRVFGQKHFGHAAGAEPGANLVVPESRADVDDRHLLLLRAPGFQRPGPTHHVFHRVVPFVARILVNTVGGIRGQRKRHRPRAGVDVRILNRC